MNDFLRQHSQLYVFVKARLRSTAAKLFGKKLSNEFVFPPSFVKSAQASIEKTWQDALQYIQELSTFALECSNAKTYLVIIPGMQQVLPECLKTELTVYGIPIEDVDMQLPNRITLCFGEDKEIPTLDLLTDFLVQGRFQTLYYPVNGHWNENGHCLAGQLIYKWLVTKNLVPINKTQP